MRNTTPSVITPEILELCRRINPKETPRYIQVLPAKSASIGQCYFNVDHYQKANGGKVLFGWNIWECARVYVEAEHHAVWISDDDVVVDISPKVDAEEYILFLSQPSAKFYVNNPNWRDNVRLPLSNDKRVVSFVDACSRFQKFELRHSRAKGRLREVAIPAHLVERYENLQRECQWAYRKVGDFLNE